jgi:aminopeptidase 2
LKATFEITLNVPKDRTALSNMDVKSEKDIKIDGKDLVEVVFNKTPIMSTYLVALCVGEFEYLESVAKPKLEGAKEIKCRVYTLPGQREMGM